MMLQPEWFGMLQYASQTYLCPPLYHFFLLIRYNLFVKLCLSTDLSALHMMLLLNNYLLVLPEKRKTIVWLAKLYASNTVFASFTNSML